MSTEQRRALAATIPTTEVIKDAVTYPRERLGEPLDINPERFEAWLARVKRDAAHEALDGLLAHAEERCGLSKSHRARDGWNTVAGATQDYRDTHYSEETQ